MYFVLSKSISYLAIPSNIIMLIIIFGLLLWPTRFGPCGRRLMVIGTLLLLVAGLSPVGTALLVPLENLYPQWQVDGAAPDGVVVLGGGVFKGYLSSQRHVTTPGPEVGRLLAAIDVHNRYPTARIVFAGGSPVGIPEADFAAAFLQDYGVPLDSIFIDRKSRDTIENAVECKRIANPQPGQRWLLVTSAYHMPRAMELFRAAGFPVEAYPVDFRTTGWRDLAAVPASPLAGLVNLNIAVHEWEGLLVDWATRRSHVFFPGPALMS